VRGRAGGPAADRVRRGGSEPERGKDGRTEAGAEPRGADPAGDHDPATEPLAADLRVAILRSARLLRSERTTSLTDAQLSVLAVLDRHGAMGAGDLAGHECVQPPSMTRTLTPLVEAGLVDRTPDPQDRRQVRLSLTPSGGAVVRDTRRRRDRWLADWLGCLTPAERDDLARAAALLARLDRRGGGAVER
jgi:DNA-binding MarR family transcriptional regulator